VDTAAGMRVGDKIKLMGFDVGEITEITAMPPFNYYNVFVSFVVYQEFYGYLWSDSRARVTAADFLGGRIIEVTKGTNGYPTFLFNELQAVTVPDAMRLAPSTSWVFNQEIADPAGGPPLTRLYQPLTNLTALEKLSSILGTNGLELFDKSQTRSRITAVYNDQLGRYVPFDRESKGYYLVPDEAPALTERLEKVVNMAETALPNILDLTNRITEVLTNAVQLTRRADDVLAGAQPALTNLTLITGQLSNPDGSLGQWLIPTNIRQQIEGSLQAAQTTLTNVDATVASTQTNLTVLTSSLLLSLENLANLTSNLNAQVQANRFILGDISDLVRHTDELMQGLQRHWLLKGAFEDATNAPLQSIIKPTLGPQP
jgi:hypothetical protein